MRRQKNRKIRNILLIAGLPQENVFPLSPTSFPGRRGSLFDESYAALAEQAGTTPWMIDERSYNGARAIGLDFVMHPVRDPLP